MRHIIGAFMLGVLALVWVPNVQAAAGRTPGTFNVSQSGAATYTIPIWVPAGPRGIQPNLAIVYNSQAGDGILGPGWNLAGLSMISRCNKTYAQDTTPAPVALVTTDGYCLNGNRLRLTAGTYGLAGSAYQTEVADFSLITASGTSGNGPAAFIVKGKDGLTYEYGNTTDSRILYGSTAGQWLLDKVSDRSGNNYKVTYGTGATGSVAAGVPLTISYTASSYGASTYNYTVGFTYGTKVSQVPATNDPAIVGYVNGVQIVNTNLLLAISVSSASSGSSVLVRKYALAYGAAPITTRARLTSVTECGGSAGTDCLPPTTIAWQNGAAGLSSTPISAIATSGAALMAARDFNGDGLADILYRDSTGLKVVLSTGTGFTTPYIVTTSYTIYSTGQLAYGDVVASGRNDILVPISGVLWRYTWQASSSSFIGASLAITLPTPSYKTALLDINGDGLPDVVMITLSGTYYIVNVYTRLNTSSGGTASFSSTQLTSYSYTKSCNKLIAPCTLDIYTGLEGGTNFQGMDFNGDGRADLWVESSDNDTGLYKAQRLISNGSTFTAGTSQNNDLPVSGFANWNNDRCTDILSDALTVATCDGGVGTQIPLPGGLSVIGTMDWDGDGRSDLLIRNGTTVGVYESTGTGLTSLITTSIPAGALIMDMQGDGLGDMVAYLGSALVVYPHNAASMPPDLVTSITDGLGMNASPTYVSIAQGNYTKYTNGVYPDADYIGPRYVVNQFSASDGLGGTYTNQFWYYGEQMNYQGRGLDGFYAMRALDSRNSTYHYQYFERAFPMTGMLLEDDLYQSNVTTFLGYRHDTHAVTTLSSASNNQRYFPYTSSSLVRNYEAGGAKNGQQIASTTTNYTMDSYGNATNISSTVTDTDATAPVSPYNGQVWTTTVVNTIAPDTANWCLNLPTQTTVTKSSTTAPSITRTTGFTPDYINCRMTQRVVEPSSATYKVTEDLLYDAFGNVNSDKITGLNLTARTTLTNWGTAGQFPYTVTNALSQITQYGYNYDLGVRTSATDPNSIQTSWQYDNFARQTQETRPDGTYTTTDYNVCGAANSWCGTSNASTDLRIESYFKNYGVGGGLINQQYALSDGYGRTRYKKHTDIAGAWDIEQTIYDALGRVSQQSVPYQSTAYFTTYTYDLLNRVTQASRPISASNSTSQTTTYSYQGRTTVTTDPQSKTSTKITQVTGNLGRSQDHNGYYQDFGYDSFGSLLSVRDSSAPVNTLFAATYDYGLGAFQRTTSDIDRGNWFYSYDALGELTAYTDAKSQNFTFGAYDPLGRPTTRTEPDLATTWTWGSSAASHNIGKLYSFSSSASTTTYSEIYTFDSAGRLTNRLITPSPIGAQGFDLSYNATTGLLDTLTYPISTSSYRLKLQYSYANGYLQNIKDFNALTTVFWTANTVNQFGEITQETLGNGVVTNRTFDAVTSWMSSNQAGVGGGAALLNQSYLHDLVGNVTQRQNNALGLTESACYDNLYRLDHTTAAGVCSGTTSLQMAYDVMGNITSRSDVNAGAAWTYDAVHKHQVKTAGTGNSYSYDLNGNMVSRNGSAIYWTSYNYPVTINAPGEAATFDYGPDHQYWRQTYTGPSGAETTYYLGKLLERVDTSAGSDYRHYIVANGEQVAIYSRTSTGTNTLRYALEDHEGSFSSILTSAGTTYVSESFAPFGTRRNPATWSGPPVAGDLTLINGVTRTGYTGQNMLGAMGLIHMNGRVEDSITGRFLSADPYVQDPGNTQSYNRYSYVANNPLTMADPTGFKKKYGPGAANPMTGSILPGVDTGARCSGNCGSGSGSGSSSASNGSGQDSNGGAPVGGDASGGGGSPGASLSQEAAGSAVDQLVMGQVTVEEMTAGGVDYLGSPPPSDNAQDGFAWDISRMDMGFGFAFAAGEAFSGENRFGSNFRLYKPTPLGGVFRANGSVRTVSLAKVFKGLGFLPLAVDTAHEVNEVSQGSMSLGHFFGNLGVGAIGLVPVLTPASTIYLLFANDPRGPAQAMTDYQNSINGLRAQGINPGMP